MVRSLWCLALALCSSPAFAQDEDTISSETNSSETNSSETNSSVTWTMSSTELSYEDNSTDSMTASNETTMSSMGSNATAPTITSASSMNASMSASMPAASSSASMPAASSSASMPAASSSASMTLSTLSSAQSGGTSSSVTYNGTTTSADLCFIFNETTCEVMTGAEAVCTISTAAREAVAAAFASVVAPRAHDVEVGQVCVKVDVCGSGCSVKVVTTGALNATVLSDCSASPGAHAACAPLKATGLAPRDDETASGGDDSGGLGWGWYLLMAAGGVAVAGVVGLVIVSQKRKAATRVSLIDVLNDNEMGGSNDADLY